MTYRPSASSPAPPEESSAERAPVPFGVQLLALLAGILILLMTGKSAWQDYKLADRLNHLDAYYEAVPAKWLKVEVRRDASGSNEFYPDVLFDARVDGESVWGWRLSLEEKPADSLYWVQRLAPYRVGDTVTAYVDRKDPKDSFIEKRTEGGTYRLRLRMMLGAAFALFGATLIFLAVSAWVRGPGKKSVKMKKAR